MDFAKKLTDYENVTTKSGVRILETKKDVDENDEKAKLENLLLEQANKAASDLFLGSGSRLFSTIKTLSEDSVVRDKDHLIDAKLYPTKLLPPSSIIEAGSLVVIFESFDSLNFVYATPGEVFHNKNGHFHHDDFIGKPYGCKIRSRNNRGFGFLYLLRPTPELWARSLNHRTQIVHELDSAIVIFNLNIRPNMVVCESGTGSGAMSHCIMRAIAPHGKLHTYEFNQMRAHTAKEEFKRNGVDHLVDVHWRDVCGKPSAESTSNDGRETKEGESLTFGSGGFDIGPAAADAIFLDLPEPWLAIPHAAHTIKPNGGLCSYSPCMEQTQRTCQAMRDYGFHSLKTIEVRLREHYVDEVELEKVPTFKLPRDMNVNNYVPGQSVSPVPSNNGESGPEAKDMEVDTNKKEEETKDSKEVKEPVSKKRMLGCRPFSNMRGHTAFLTFAKAGNKSYPDPLKE
ncbi:tRNA (adenine57-N1/adenine58-N1)-methyltransferase catalytic subunit [Chaetoceros tenuissimus]|uniref:tRNA (adenine(58)-N(1))-methyltransferase n=1 Tax=Chaetoceros tenuissimus TaxID=426638 RepID=A0AAD3D124_9STRA|nr:tRNA (adenine57-N1/adenine58-N1)-methyltransferase catalytic subunit [Chaetoceros tenuissimus]